jgi:hypothetical protein
MRSVEMWVGCIAGALHEDEYKSLLADAGFEGIDIEPTRVYKLDDAREFFADAGIDSCCIPKEVDGAFMSGFVRATKPLAT